MATKWGIVSAGKISHDFVTVLRSMPKGEHEVVAVAARDLTRAKEFAALHKVPKAYSSYAELAKDKDVEIIYVGCIHPHHFEVGKMMMEAGKHVLIEKPLAMNLKQAQALIDIARKNKRFLMEAMWSRFFPIRKQLEKELAENSIGEIIHVQRFHGFDGTGNVRITDKDAGGGGILDLGVYLADELFAIFREKPSKIAAIGVLNEQGVDIRVAASFIYSGGRTATATLCTNAPLNSQTEIFGTKGKIMIPHPIHCPEEIITPTGSHKFLLPETVLPCNFINSSGLRYEAAVIRKCLQKGLLECPEMMWKDSEMLAEFTDELRQQIGVSYTADNV